jgi:nicotinate-nucleotide pyrophosphorylase (carboxylating)
MTYFVTDCAEIVRRALQEDIGNGDITTLLTVAPETQARAVMVAKASGVLAGLPVVAEVYAQIDSELEITSALEDGAQIAPGTILCELRGAARSILTGERVALNFVQRLSGIATKTARFVALVAGTRARIVDTRKSTLCALAAAATIASVSSTPC